jgi:hypothetical protein
MRKRLLVPLSNKDAAPKSGWLDLEQAAVVEVSSEAGSHPIEGALLSDGAQGWRANSPGLQTIRLRFDHPQTIRLIRVVFREEESSRTQDFVLRWLPQGESAWKEIVRQQWNFNPPNTVEESEQYNVELLSAVAIELSINPDISRAGAMASLQRLQVSAEPQVKAV